MKKIKFAIKALLGLLIALVVSIVGLMFWLDPNDFKEEIAASSQDALGREIVIEGDLSWSLYPELGLSADDITVANVKGFSAPTFLQADTLIMGVELLPLFKRKIQVNRVQLKGLVANLQVNSKGENNWSKWSTESDEASKKPSESQAKKPSTNKQSEPMKIDLSGFDIVDARINYTDIAGGTAFMLEDVNISTGEVVLWEPIDFKGDFKLKNKYPKLDSTFNFAGRVIADVPKNEFGVENFVLNAKASGEKIPNNALSLQTKTNILVNTKTQQVNLKSLKIKLDETNINGKATVNGFKKPIIRFDVAIDQFNADKYIKQSNTKGTADAPVEQTTSEDSKVSLPLAMLRKFNVKGGLTIGQFQIMNIKTQNVSAKLTAKKGLVDLKPMTFDLYNGQFNGAFSLNVKSKLPKYAVNARLKDLNVYPFMVDFLKFKKIKGVGGFDVNVNTQGEWVSKIKRNLNGTVAVALDKGVIEANFLKDFKELAVMTGKPEWADNIKEGKTTPFNKLEGLMTINNGKINSKGLTVKTKDGELVGEGSFDIPTTYVDAGINLNVNNNTCRVPLKGKVAEINYASFAKNAIPNCIKDFAQRKVQSEIDKKKAELEAEAQKKIDEEKKKLQEKIDAEKKKLKEKALEELKKLF